MNPRAILRAALVAAAIAAVAPVAPFAAQALLPIDEAARQPDFFTFRARLQVALAARDTAAVLVAVDPAIKNSFGGDDGIDAFRRMWILSDPASPFWAELSGALALGGSFHDDSTFVAPYVFSRWPGNLDAFEHAAVVGQGVRVRAAPAGNADVLAALDFAIVPLATGSAGAADPASWTAVRLADGRTGWVAARYVRSPVGWRAIFARGPAGWRLVTFVAGD